MKRLSITQLVPGMTVAEDVYDLDHELLIQKGTILTDKLITKLDLYGILTIFVEDIIQPVRPAEDSTDTELSYSERIKSSPEFQLFKTDFENDVELFRENMNLVIQKNTSLDVNTLLKNTMAIVANHSGSISILDMLQNMREYDDSTYTHSLNVALICNVFAGWLHFSQEDIELATLCGLFHDIGKLCIPDSIIKKPDRLTNEEYDVIKTHTIEGYKILQNQPVNDHIKNAALMHHERCDGSGYPFGLTGNRIDKFAKIVSIADVYDAMTAARVYRGPLCPFTVIDIFEKEGLQKYESEYILCFLKNVVLTYIGQRVRLTNGQEGDVVFINPQQLSRPMIKCGDTFVDLSKQKDIAIERLL